MVVKKFSLPIYKALLKILTITKEGAMCPPQILVYLHRFRIITVFGKIPLSYSVPGNSLSFCGNTAVMTPDPTAFAAVAPGTVK